VAGREALEKRGIQFRTDACALGSERDEAQVTLDIEMTESRAWEPLSAEVVLRAGVVANTESLGRDALCARLEQG
jgi:hypothetical protein